MIPTPHYDVFLSHNGADQADVTTLADALRTQAHLHPFLDRWHLIPGMPWQEAIEAALAQSETVAVFFGPSGVSPWHNEQMRVALDEAVRTRDEVRVIPVLLPGATEAAVSKFLARRTWVDFRRGLDDAEALQRFVAGIKGEASADGAYTLPDEPAPYRGLLRFETEHTRFFFGRHLDQQRLLQKLSQQNFLAVVGASGSGKSSLVRAGLLSALATDALPDSRTWRILTLTPGSQPLRALAQQVATLPAAGDRLVLADTLTERFSTHTDGLRTAITAYLAERPQTVLLVVDQFEELFTLCTEGPERCRTQTEQLIANLADAVQHAAGYIRVLITLRADFLDRCLVFPALRDLLQDRQYLLGPLDEPALREAIVRPAQEVGALFEKGLVNTILRDVSAAPGALPLLQHALYELWRARRGPWLTIDAYEASGGVAGALQRRAQATYENLSPAQQAIAHNIFLRLTALGEGVSDTRRRVDRAELYAVDTDPAQVDAVLRALSAPDARLIVSDEASVEVAHETLIQQWNTLRTWLEADREALRIHRHLTESAQEWQGLGRDPGALYRGLLLAPAAAWAAAHVDQLNPLERAFLDASLALQTEERAEREAQRQREIVAAQRLAQEAEARAQEQTASATRLRRRALLLAGVGLVAVLLAITAGMFSWRATANAERANAESTKAIASANRADAASTRAIANEQTANTERANAQAASTQAVQQRDLAEHRQRQAEAGELAALSSDFRTSDLPLSLLLAAAAVNTTYLVDADYTNEAQAALYSALTVPQPQLRKAITDSQQIWSADFSPDGSRFITTACDELNKEILCLASTVRLWNANGSLIKQFAQQTATIKLVRYSPDGTRIVTADFKGGARLWDANGQPMAELVGHTESIAVVTFNAASTRLLTAAWDGTVRLWDADGKLLAVLESHKNRVKSAVFNAAGTRILTTGCDKEDDEGKCSAGSARLWDAAGKPIITFADDSGYVNSAAFNANGSLIITAECAALNGVGNCTVGIARIWDAAAKLMGTLAGYQFTSGVQSASFNGAGTRIMAASEEAVALWSGSGNFLTTLGMPATEDPRFATADFNGAGTQIVTTQRPSSANPGTAPVRLWDIDGKFLAELWGQAGIVTAALFNPDATRLLTADLGGTLQLWDMGDAVGNFITKIDSHSGLVSNLAFNPAGTRLVTTGDDGVRLWDANGHLLAKLEGYEGRPVFVAKFNQAGTRIATVGCDKMDCTTGSLRLWDADGSVIGVVEAYRFGSGFDFNPTGVGMIVGSEGNTARLLDANSKTIAVLSGHTGPINTTFFSPDGTHIVTASEDGTARLWDTKGTLITTLIGHVGSVQALFSPDGAHIITYSDDNTVRVWDANGDLESVLTGHTAPVAYASINRAGTRILSESDDGTTRLWSMAGKLIMLLGSHTQKVEMATFDPAGTQILTVDCDKMNEYDFCISRAVRLWDTEGKLITIVDTHWVTRAMFSPDGTQIATVGCDELDPTFHIDCLNGGAWLWKTYPTIEVMLTEANRRAGRTLTPNECRQFLRVEQCL